MSLPIPVEDLRLIQQACVANVRRLHEQGRPSEAVRMMDVSAMLATMFGDGVTRYELRAIPSSEN